jgi:hypothetical protein
MAALIHFTVKRTDGTAELFSAAPFSTLLEAMGSKALADANVFKDGRLVNKYMTLTHENITEGSVLFAAKPQPSKKKRRRARFVRTSQMDLEMAAEDKHQHERARTADVIWSAWEMSSNHDRMLAKMQNRQATVCTRAALNVQPSNLERAKAIQATPLPTCFRKDGTDEPIPDHTDL